MNKLKPNKLYALKGEVKSLFTRRARTKNMTITTGFFEDSSGNIKVTWFNQPYLKNVLENKEVYLAGKPKVRKNQLVLTNPDYELANKKSLHVGRIIPVYHETKGLSSKWLRRKIYVVLEKLEDYPEYFPQSILKKTKLLNFKKAINQIHFPDDKKMITRSRRRFALEELIFMILIAQEERSRLKKEKGVLVKFDESLSRGFTKNLPFELTDAQKRCAWQIIQDMSRPYPMNRLLNGDVGSGKTVVGAIASLNVLSSGWQVALMAPTEVLAQQHYETLKKMFSSYEFKVELYTGSDKTIDLTKADKPTKPFLVVGTHALIQKDTYISKLGLAIVDEQHRFGVRQRARLLKRTKNQNKRPNFLTMTATPIPRTLSLALFGDLNVSFLDEKPKKRKPVITEIKTRKKRKGVYEVIKKELNKGRKAFIIYPQIEENDSKKGKQESNDKKTVLEEFERLKDGPFKEFNLGVLHGRMDSEEKKKRMGELKTGKIDLLISTSVVEIGVDIPQATIMVVEGAENFGLSQLHQFRGRVGRNTFQSYCFLIPHRWSKRIKRRLAVLAQTDNGFKIAREDLKLRGPGEIFGKKQHGLIEFQIANYFNLKLIKKAQKIAKKITGESSNLKKYPELKKRVEKLKKETHLE